MAFRFFSSIVTISCSFLLTVISSTQAQTNVDLRTEGGTYRSENTQILFYPVDGSNPLLVYNGNQRAIAIVSYHGAIYTAFNGGGIYRSPDGQNLGGGGRTQRLYQGQKVMAMIPCRGGLFTAFDGAGIYFSPDGQNPGGGGSTKRVYRGTQLVRRMICQPGTGMNGAGSVVTTFSGGGVYQSIDGNNLGGGGLTIRLN